MRTVNAQKVFYRKKQRKVSMILIAEVQKYRYTNCFLQCCVGFGQCLDGPIVSVQSVRVLAPLPASAPCSRSTGCEWEFRIKHINGKKTIHVVV